MPAPEDADATSADVGSPGPGAAANAAAANAAASEPFAVVDDTPDAESADETGPAVPEEHALNGVRVRQLSALRRGAYRARSYCVIALGVCATAAVQFGLMTVRHVRVAGWEYRPVGYACGAAAALMAAAFFFRRAAELTRELRHRPAALADPETPPDFSTLSDGSHHWKNLEQMRNET